MLKNELQKHVKTHQCEDLAICAGCGKAYSSHYLKNHKPNCKRDASRDEIIRAVSDMKIEYSCDFCDMKIFGKAFLAVHMKRTHLVQSSQSDFECPSCDKVFKSRYDRNLHNRQVHRKKKGVSCEYCGRMFVKLRMLEIHQKSQACAVNHSKCEICQRVFKTKSGFENHQKKCTNEKIEERKFRKPKQIKEWICEFCGKYLTTQPGHRRHLIARHKDVMYTKPPTTHPCPHCHKVFYFKTDLKNHVVCKHLKLRNFKCELCPKGYAVASGLRRHVKRVHNRTQEEDDKRKKFICHFCPAKYENDKALSKHLMHHDLSLPDRPFHCLECTRSFLTKKHMNAHMRIKHST